MTDIVHEPSAVARLFRGNLPAHDIARRLHMTPAAVDHALAEADRIEAGLDRTHIVGHPTYTDTTD